MHKCASVAKRLYKIGADKKMTKCKNLIIKSLQVKESGSLGVGKSRSQEVKESGSRVLSLIKAKNARN